MRPYLTRWTLFALCFVALLFVLAGCAHNTGTNPPAPPPANADHTITLTFQQNFADNPPCSATVTTSCINGFDEGYAAGAAQTQLHTDTAAICTGSTQPENCSTTFNAVVPLGPVVFYVTTTGVNASGAAVASSSAEAPAVNVALDPPAGVVASVQ